MSAGRHPRRPLARPSASGPWPRSAGGRVQALVATDVAARGIHVDDVACVVHFDPPADDKDYVHRSGRTGRAGAAGTVVSLVCEDNGAAVRDIQRRLGFPTRFSHPDVASLAAAPPFRPTTRPQPAGAGNGSGNGGRSRPEPARNGNGNGNGGRGRAEPAGNGGRGRTDRVKPDGAMLELAKAERAKADWAAATTGVPVPGASPTAGPSAPAASACSAFAVPARSDSPPPGLIASGRASPAPGTLIRNPVEGPLRGPSTRACPRFSAVPQPVAAPGANRNRTLTVVSGNPVKPECHCAPRAA